MRMNCSLRAELVTARNKVAAECSAGLGHEPDDSLHRPRTFRSCVPMRVCSSDMSFMCPSTTDVWSLCLGIAHEEFDNSPCVSRHRGKYA